MAKLRFTMEFPIDSNRKPRVGAGWIKKDADGHIKGISISVSPKDTAKEDKQYLYVHFLTPEQKAKFYPNIQNAPDCSVFLRSAQLDKLLTDNKDPEEEVK